MDARTRFFEFSQTVNERLILGVLGSHGDYVFHATESALSSRFYQWDGSCYYADILGVFRKGNRDYLVGVEVKDWKHPVHPKLCWDYLKTYRKSCEYFYMAARAFSPIAYQIEDIGLINLDRMEVVKHPRYLFPEKEQRGGVVRVLKKYAKGSREVIEDPYQMSLDKYL